MRASFTPTPVANTHEVSWALSKRDDVFIQESIGNVNLDNYKC